MKHNFKTEKNALELLLLANAFFILQAILGACACLRNSGGTVKL